MSWWGGNGLNDGDPLILEECETPTTSEDFKRIGYNSLDEILKLEKSDKWERIPYSDDRVSLMGLPLNDSPIKCVRTSAVYNGTVKQVRDFMNSGDINNRKKWDTELLELRVIEKHDDVEVVFQAYKAPFGVTNRSFVATRCEKVLEDGTIIIGGTSINHNKCPYQSKYVRGTATSAIIYEPEPGKTNKCRMTRLVKVDPKGSIPTMAINLGIKKAGEATVNLIEAIKKESKNWDKEPEIIIENVSDSRSLSFNTDNTNDNDNNEESSLFYSNSDDEDEFFETSSYFELPDEMIKHKIDPIHQRLSFVETNTLNTTKKLESLVKKTKRMKQKQTSMRIISFSHLSKWMKLFLLSYPILILIIFNFIKKQRKRR